MGLNGTTRIVYSQQSPGGKSPKGSALKAAMDPEKVQREILAVKGDEKMPYKREGK